MSTDDDLARREPTVFAQDEARSCRVKAKEASQLHYLDVTDPRVRGHTARDPRRDQLVAGIRGRLDTIVCTLVAQFLKPFDDLGSLRCQPHAESSSELDRRLVEFVEDDVVVCVSLDELELGGPDARFAGRTAASCCVGEPSYIRYSRSPTRREGGFKRPPIVVTEPALHFGLLPPGLFAVGPGSTEDRKEGLAPFVRLVGIVVCRNVSGDGKEVGGVPILLELDPPPSTRKDLSGGTSISLGERSCLQMAATLTRSFTVVVHVWSVRQAWKRRRAETLKEGEGGRKQRTSVFSTLPQYLVVSPIDPS